MADQRPRDRILSVTVGRKKDVVPGMEVWLPGTAGRIAGWYRFDWAERRPDDRYELNVYGPLRKRKPPHYRIALADDVTKVQKGRS